MDVTVAVVMTMMKTMTTMMIMIMMAIVSGLDFLQCQCSQQVFSTYFLTINAYLFARFKGRLFLTWPNSPLWAMAYSNFHGHAHTHRTR